MIGYSQDSMSAIEEAFMAKLRSAIDDHCKSCGYDPKENGTWRLQIENCVCCDCHLYPVRPVTIRKRMKNRIELKEEGISKETGVNTSEFAKIWSYSNGK